MCVCGARFTVDHAMICKHDMFITQRHNKLGDLEAELLIMVCYDVEVEPGSQPVTGEDLNRCANQAPDTCLDIHARGFWERQRSAYLILGSASPMQIPIRILLPSSCRDTRTREKVKVYIKGHRGWTRDFHPTPPVVFSTTGGMGKECIRYHCRLAELLVVKRGDTYNTTISWGQAKVLFALLRGGGALLCIRASRANRRPTKKKHLKLEKGWPVFRNMFFIY